jgi:hypothetical protein
MDKQKEKLIKKTVETVVKQVNTTILKNENSIISESIKLTSPNILSESRLINILNSSNKNLLISSSTVRANPIRNPINIIAEPTLITPFAALHHFCLTYSKQIAIVLFLTFSFILLCKNPEIFKIFKNLFSNKDYDPPEKNIIFKKEVKEQFVEKPIVIETIKIVEEHNSRGTKNHSPTISRFLRDQEKKQLATLELTESLNQLRTERKNSQTKLEELSLINTVDKIQIRETLKKIESGSPEEYEIWKKEAVILKERITSDIQEARVLREKMTIIKMQKKNIIKKYKKERKEKD